MTKTPRVAFGSSLIKRVNGDALRAVRGGDGVVEIASGQGAHPQKVIYKL